MLQPELPELGAAPQHEEEEGDELADEASSSDEVDFEAEGRPPESLIVSIPKPRLSQFVLCVPVFAISDKLDCFSSKRPTFSWEFDLKRRIHNCVNQSLFDVCQF